MSTMASTLAGCSSITGTGYGVIDPCGEINPFCTIGTGRPLLKVPGPAGGGPLTPAMARWSTPPLALLVGDGATELVGTGRG